MIKQREHERVPRGDDLSNFTGGARPRLDEPRRALSGRLRKHGTPPFAVFRDGALRPDGGPSSPRPPPPA
jgi:hypothetical protein